MDFLANKILGKNFLFKSYAIQCDKYSLSTYRGQRLQKLENRGAGLKNSRNTSPRAEGRKPAMTRPTATPEVGMFAGRGQHRDEGISRL